MGVHAVRTALKEVRDSASRCGDQNEGILMTMKKESALQFRSGQVLFQRQAPFLAQSLFLNGSA